MSMKLIIQELLVSLDAQRKRIITLSFRLVLEIKEIK